MLTTTGKNIKVRCIVADLSKMTTYQDYIKIAEDLSDIDIGLLFLNAGWTCIGPFKDLTG